MFMLILRIPEIDTDLLITLNAADMGNASGSLANVQQMMSQRVMTDPTALFMSSTDSSDSFSAAEKVFHAAISSFRIKDWSLFG